MLTRRQFVVDTVGVSASALGASVCASTEIPNSIRFHPDFDSTSLSFQVVREMLVYRINGDSPDPRARSAGWLWFNRLIAVRGYIDHHYEVFQTLPRGIHTITDPSTIPNSSVIDLDVHIKAVAQDIYRGELSFYPEWVDLGDLRKSV
jgi:hypothetical protein